MSRIPSSRIMTTPRRMIAQRIGLIALIGVVAVAFLSSSLLAGIIAVATIAAVLVDSVALARFGHSERASGDATPQKITVDLRRRS